ncbi:MICOS complex subunit mic25a-like isoform X2 [Nelusetta ayraudi]|uniref:MICOS complex subunit mic25a-like isoform X2 n=1 Tax=Nelusetta ayraudi TaxID=303726 RepID=UPI003F6E5037
MGSGESTTRKVSFGVDDEDRVRILRGVKLSEDVLQRMRGVANIPPERSSSSTSVPKKDTGASQNNGPSSKPQQKSPPAAPPRPQSSTSIPASPTKEEQNRYERHQARLKEELAKIAEREELTRAMTRERLSTRQEAEGVKQLAQQLQKKDSQLKAMDAFYREQLAQLQKRNLEQYEESKEKFHQAATEAEATVRARSTQPVCSHLQAQLLTCYGDNKGETLRCSDLAKEYMRCINAAKKCSVCQNLKRFDDQHQTR